MRLIFAIFSYCKYLPHILYIALVFFDYNTRLSLLLFNLVSGLNVENFVSNARTKGCFIFIRHNTKVSEH